MQIAEKAPERGATRIQLMKTPPRFTFLGPNVRRPFAGKGLSKHFSITLGALIAIALTARVALADDFFVSDSSNNHIKHFDANGAPIGSIEGVLNFPRACIIGPDGNLYVANTFGDNIVKVDAQGVTSVIRDGYFPARFGV